jgi:hypothetical protein
MGENSGHERAFWVRDIVKIYRTDAGGQVLRPAKLMLSQESKKSEWLSKKRQMQGAQLSRNEAYLGTPQ